MEILCKVTDAGLVPMYDSDLDEKRKLKRGEVVRCTVTKPRNWEHHKKFFALVRMVYENLPEELHTMLDIRSERDMLTVIKLDLGYAHTVWYGTRQVVVADSISFGSMDQTEFQEFYDRAIDNVLNLYLRGNTRQEIIENIESFK